MSASGETIVSAQRTLPGPGRTDLSVRGMDCGNCVRHVREALEAVPGVAQVSVDLATSRAVIRWAADAQPNVAAALTAVTDAGYEPSALESTETEAAPRARWFSGWTRNLVIGLPVTAVLMLGEWVFGLAHTNWFPWLAFGLATVVQLFAGARFYRGAWMQLKARSSNMDTLVALGSTTAYVYSIWAVAHGLHAYFMESAAIITLISVGHWLEGRMAERAANSLRKLLDLAPPQARVVRNGVEVMVPAAELRSGDLIALRPGERVPTDGMVVEGASAFDESMLTGEPLPVDKVAGAQVYGGTANTSSRVVVRVTATGEATALAQIVAAVERAQNSRADIQRLGDRVSNVFVPVVVLVALAAALWWGLAPEHAQATAEHLSRYLWPIHLPHSTALALAVIHFAAVLVVACPCAMGLATPAAIMAGANAAAERGILIRDGVALEKAGAITAVVFDKTGTLTQGRPIVTRTERFAVDGFDAVALAASLARHSNHPVSQAIAAGSSERADLTDWREIPGSGVAATLNGSPARLGSVEWLRKSGIPTQLGDARIAELQRRGATVVGLSYGSALAALFAVEDTLKEGAGEIVAGLAAQGHDVYLLTGDNQQTAEVIGRSIGIPAEHIVAGVRPEKKAEFVRDLQSRGAHVAFVGDGINDAPALEQADLGIAVGRATDVAQMAADIVLLKSDVHAIPESLGLARATLRAIKQNLFWAFFYNAAAIPLAALGFLSPVLCALTMGLSDVVVIGNALRLRRWRPRR